MELKKYMDDGADWQAQSVLACLRAYESGIVDETWNDKYHRYDGRIDVGRLENCREQGYVFTLLYDYRTIINFWVYEHRNSDNICVKEFTGTFINTPTIDDVPMKDKYDYTKSFEYGHILECVGYLEQRMKELLHERMKFNL